jgi:dCTP deaminase
MSILVDWQIRIICENGGINPYNMDLVNPASIDIRLGSTAVRETQNGFEDELNFYKFTAENPYYMMPGEFLLASSLEWLNFPENICTHLLLKSTMARMGISHSFAGWIENGFKGVLTLELKNYCRYDSIKLYPGMRIAQLILHSTMIPDNLYDGKYANNGGVVKAIPA